MDFIDYVDHVNRHPRVTQTRRRDSFYASDASLKVENPWGEWEPKGTCLRKQWYRLKNVPVPLELSEVEFDRTAGYGSVIHEYEIERMKRAGIYLGSEIGFYDPVNNVSGRVDVFVANPFSKTEPKEMLGVEIKSVGSYFAAKGTVVPHPVRGLEPRIQHVLQIMVYADYYKSGVKTWLLLYFDRGNGRAQQHTIVLAGDGVSVNGELMPWKIESIYERWRLLRDCLEADTIPDRDYDICYNKDKLEKMLERQQLSKSEATAMRKGQPIYKGDVHCQKFCPYRLTCWKDKCPQT